MTEMCLTMYLACLGLLLTKTDLATYFFFFDPPFFLSYLISMTDGTLIHSFLAFPVRDITMC